MAIYMHPIDEKPSQVDENNWVEIDFLGWNPNNDNHESSEVVLVRRLDSKSRKPCLQELMFTELYNNHMIDELKLEIPQSTNGLDYKEYVLRNVSVLTYTMSPALATNTKQYEKLVITTESTALH